MEGKRVSIKNKWYTILDKIIAIEKVTIFAGTHLIAVTKYLVIDEDDQISTILPENIEVYERIQKPLPRLPESDSH